MHLLYKHGPLKTGITKKHTVDIKYNQIILYNDHRDDIYAVSYEMSENLKNTDNRVGEELLHDKFKERVGCLTIQHH